MSDIGCHGDQTLLRYVKSKFMSCDVPCDFPCRLSLKCLHVILSCLWFISYVSLSKLAESQWVRHQTQMEAHLL